MESANLHHHHQHQLQDHQFVGSSSLSTSSFYAGVGSNNNTWNPNLILNSNNLNGNVNGGLSNSKELRRHGDILVLPSLSTSMVQDLGYHHWASNTCNFTNQSAHDLNLAKIKEELSDSPYKFRQTTIDDQSHSDDFHLHSPSYVKHEREPNLHNLSEKLFLKTFSSGCQLNELQGGALYYSSQSGAGFGGTDACNRGSYSQIFPSANISNLIPSSSPFLSSSGMNLQVLDLLNSTKFGVGFGQPTNNNLGLYNETPSFGLEHMQESTNWLTNSPDKVPSFTNGTTETKRSSTVSESKASHTAPKKARFESRSSLTPFKVRKEKLGDRIAALQQLVAPFGKTDTASVLMEAIGYIKFLQDQVETLSVPYMMKSSPNNTHRSIQEDLSEDGEQETKLDLRSRGLCLVPLTCMSYITNDNLGVWPGPPNYGGGGRT